MDYSAYTVRELRELAQAKLGAASASLKTKAELVSALQALEGPQTVSPDFSRPSAPLTPPSLGFARVEPRVVDRDFFVEAGRPRPRVDTEVDRVLAFNQDPELIAISWQLTPKSVAEGARLCLVGADGVEQVHSEALSTPTGFALMKSGVGGPSAHAQVRHVDSGAVLAKSGTVSVPGRGGVAKTQGAPGVAEAERGGSARDKSHPSSW
jgi:hypothetical protein